MEAVSRALAAHTRLYSCSCKLLTELVERLCQSPWVGWCPCQALGASCELGTADAAEQATYNEILEEPWGLKQPHTCLPGSAYPYPSATACTDPMAVFRQLLLAGKGHLCTPRYKAAICSSCCGVWLPEPHLFQGTLWASTF